MSEITNEFWAISLAELQKQLAVNTKGLSSSEVKERITKYGANRLKQKKRSSSFFLFINQFKNPIILILIVGAIISISLGDRVDSFIILVLIIISSFLNFWQERAASKAMTKLLSIIQITSKVIRNGKEVEINIEEIVPGDIVFLSAGDVVPADCRIIDSKDLFVNEATLTGETFPIEKSIGILSKETTLNQRNNSIFMGTNVESGMAKVLVVNTGSKTEFGKIADKLRLKQPETDFEKGIRKFGQLLVEIILVFVFLIFIANVLLNRPAIDSFLFSLAIAIGLTPELLPTIISINLARGAKKMAKNKVIVKQLIAIENFGSMNILCADKTGTLTKGEMELLTTVNGFGKEYEKIKLYAFLNATFQAGYKNPIDEAIKIKQKFDITNYSKLDELPYDFNRKLLSILVRKDNDNIMVTKGAFHNILNICNRIEDQEGNIVDIKENMKNLEKLFTNYSTQGYRLLGIAYRTIDSVLIDKNHEKDLIFLGLLIFFDPPKEGITDTVKELSKLGINFKIITGDSLLVALTLEKHLGIKKPKIITGSEIAKMSDEALIKKSIEADIFAEVEPNQKERIIIALRKSNNVVGYIGDGINDVSALHASDVGISVESAVDVAKEAGQIVLLEKDLKVIVDGVKLGRTTFMNTIKYILITISANFGNMFSMAGASLFMSFLPLLPKQILLINFVTDFPSMALASDRVDRDLIAKPRRWSMKFIAEFMVVFGFISSIFDYLTFAIFYFVFKADESIFQSSWFILSVISELFVLLSIRTHKFMFKSRPGNALLIATIIVFCSTIIIPFIPRVNYLLGFNPPPYYYLPIIFGLVFLYLITTEIAKMIFYKLVKF